MEKENTAQQTGREPLLDISTLAPDRPTVLIDGELYEFRLMQDFGAIEHQQFVRNSSRYDDLWAQEKLKPAERSEMEKLLDWLFDHALVKASAARETLAERLSGAIKREIVVTFSNAPLLMVAMAHQTTQAEGGSTTAS